MSSKRARKPNFHPPVPTMRRHSSGQARVTLSGRTIYLGPFGAVETAANYAKVVAEWEASGRTWIERAPVTVADLQATAERIAVRESIPLPAAECVASVLAEFAGKLKPAEAVAIAKARRPALFTVEPAEQPPTVREALAKYEASLDDAGRYRKNGRHTSERAIIAKAVAEFCAMHGDAIVPALDAAALLAWRDKLATRREDTDDERALCRRGINRKVQTIKRALRWLRDRKILGREAWLDMADVAPLRRGELGDERDHRRVKRAVTVEEVERVAAAAGTVVGAMLRLQAATGMRPGEACAMRWSDIDRNGPQVDGVPCWIYRVANAKTSHFGHETSYVLGPAAQRILEPFRAVGNACVFRPALHVEELREKRRAARKTAVPPSQQERDTRRTRRHRASFSVDVYGGIVDRACIAAGIDRFTPHEVRHGFATRAARRFGVLATAAAVNHASTQTTQHYLHKGYDDAARVVLGLESETAPQRCGPTTDTAARGA